MSLNRLFYFFEVTPKIFKNSKYCVCSECNQLSNLRFIKGVLLNLFLTHILLSVLAMFSFIGSFVPGSNLHSPPQPGTAGTAALCATLVEEEVGRFQLLSIIQELISQLFHCQIKNPLKFSRKNSHERYCKQALRQNVVRDNKRPLQATISLVAKSLTVYKIVTS